MSKATKETSIEAQPGQGEDRKLSDEMFREIREQIKSIRSSDNINVWNRRAYADRVRYCLWPNQSPDGKKRKQDEWDPEPQPFDGASDARVRLADMVIRTQVAMLMAAVKASNLRISSIHVGDPKIAGYLQTYGAWLLTSRMCGEWELETERLFNYGLGDSPAVSLLHIYWDREEGVRPVEWGKEDFLDMMMEIMAQAGIPFAESREDLAEELQDIDSLFSNPDRTDELLAVLQTRFPTLKLSTLRASLSDLREKGRASFPEKYLCRNEPAIEAMRMLEDVYIPANTRSPRRCRHIFRREWYSVADLEAMVTNGELDRKFVDELKNHEGKSGYPDHITASGNTTSEDYVQFHKEKEYKGLYEVIWVYTRATNDDGLIGIYTIPISEFVDIAGSKMRLMDYPHGGFPFEWFIREATTRQIQDARGWSELLTSDQNFLKTLRDLSSDHAQISSLPPFFSDSGITERELRWKPLGLIRKRRNERIEAVKIADLPRSSGDQKQEIMNMVSMYTGLPFGDVSDLISGLLQQELVDKGLGVVKRAVRKILQLAVWYDPEGFLRISGAEGDIDIQALRNAVDKLPDIEVDFNVDRFNIEYIQTIGTIVKDILLAMDTDQTIVRAEAVQFLAQELSPRFARAVTRPVEGATEAEIKDEQMNFALIMAGVEPEMKEAGQNFPLRLQTLQEIVEGNPEVLQRMTPESAAYFEARVEHLQNQIQQQENAQIGRTMGQRVQDEAPTSQPAV